MKKMITRRNFLAAAGVVAAAGVLTACGGSSSSTAASGSAAGSAAGSTASGETIKVGVMGPLSGNVSVYGQAVVNGATLYLKQVNADGGINGKQIEILTEDEQGDATQAVNCFTKMVDEGITALVGDVTTTPTLAVAAESADYNMPMVTASATAEAVTYDAETDTVNANVFRATFTDPFQGPVLASLAKDEFNADKVYCLSENGDDYGAGLVNYFKEKANELGIEVIDDVFPSQNSDFSSYMNNAKKEGVKAIFAPVSISYAQLIIDQATAQGVNVPILGSDTWDTNTIFEVAKGKDIDIYVSTFYQEGANPEFEKGIKEWINSDSKNLENNGGNDMLSAVTVMGYDAYMVALEAIKAAGSTDPAAVMAALPGVTYEGISGHIEFNETGDANRDSAYIKSVNTETGTWDFVKVQKAS